MSALRDIYKRVVTLINQASEAKDSPYKDGYLDALGMVIDDIEELGWERGEQFDDEA